MYSECAFRAEITQAEHKQDIKIVREGNLVKVIPEREIIEMPLELLFRGDKVTWKGLHTLIHEMSHDPLRDASELKKLGLDRTQREEFVTDLLSARIAIKMDYPRENIYELYKGRESVYGRFPFMKALEKATSPKKRRGPREFHWKPPTKLKGRKIKAKGRQPEITPLYARRRPRYGRAA